MGYGGNTHKPKTAEELALHPNFRLPTAPQTRLAEKTMDLVVDYVLEAAASFVSPRQEEGEDDEFECVDVARFLREELPALVKEHWRGK